MRLIVLQNDVMVADVICERETVYLGTRGDCRIQVQHPEAAPLLAAVFPDDEATWMLRVLAPNCPFQLNAKPVTDEVALTSGDEIRVFNYLIRVYPEFQERPGARVALGTSQAQLERFVQTTLPPGTILKKADEPLTLQAEHLLPLGRGSQAVAGFNTVEQFMDQLLQLALSSFGARRAWVGLRHQPQGAMEYEEGRLLTGKPFEPPQIAQDLRPRVLDRAQFALVPRVSREEPYAVMAGPLITADGVLGVVYVDTCGSRRRYAAEDLDYFSAQLYVCAAMLDAIFKQFARNRAVLVDGQTTVAHDIQSRLSPRKLPQWDELQFAAFREPGQSRSSDIYDVLRLSNNLAAFMVMQTPAGGTWPALLMSQAQTAFRVAMMHQDTPAVFLRTLNWMLYDGQPDHPVDCFVGVVDPPSGQLRYSVAGALSAYIIDARGNERALRPRERLAPIGAAKSTVYPLLPEQLATSETLAVFSHGITTAANPNQERFGEERLVNILCDGFGQLPSAMLKELLTDLRNFKEGGTQPDDITLLLAHRPT